MKFDEDTLELMAEQAEEMAWFCLNTGIAPSEYKQMTLMEVNAFVKVHNKINKERK
jgi:hypothetical protein